MGIEDIAPDSINGQVLGQNLVTMGRVHGIEIQVDAYGDRATVTIDMRLTMSLEDWEFALKHSIDTRKGS